MGIWKRTVTAPKKIAVIMDHPGSHLLLLLYDIAENAAVLEVVIFPGPLQFVPAIVSG